MSILLRILSLISYYSIIVLFCPSYLPMPFLQHLEIGITLTYFKKVVYKKVHTELTLLWQEKNYENVYLKISATMLFK